MGSASFDNWQRLKEIVADAIEAPPEERAALVLKACEDNVALAAEARKLLDAHDESSDVVIHRKTDGWLGLGGPDVLSLGGQRIGRYELVRVLGEGAMSAVYLARQANPARDVAVKLLRTALPLMDARQRFRREAQALARLRHPNIAVIYEAGLQESGDAHAIPFLAMEFIDGLPLTRYAEQKQLPRRARIELMINVILAVQHAHQQAIIHRDLKPANVLVDSSGSPKVLDFGIARIATADADRATWQTTAGFLLGTPGYMSPEQCGPNPDDVDVRTDVWSLGVMLYELLLGRLPIETRGGSITDVLRRLATSEPVPPASIDRSLSGDLETILITALSRDRDRRYATAQAFADDLRRFLEQRPIHARPPTTLYLARKFVRRNRVAIGVSLFAAGLIVAAVIVSSVGFYRARQERDRALASEQRARATSDFLIEMIGSPDPMTGRRDVTVIDMLRQNERLLDARFEDQPLTAAALHSTIGWTYFNLSEYASAAEHLRRAVVLTEAQLGARAELTLGEKCRLVTILRWQYKPLEAKALCDEALSDAVAAFGLQHAVTYPLLDNAAGIAADLHDHRAAVAQYRQLYSAGQQLFGMHDDATLTAGNNLGLALLNNGETRAAEAVLREVVDTLDRTRGPRTARAAIPRSNLGVAQLNLGQMDEALATQQEVVAVMRQAFGVGHFNTLNAELALADVLRQQGGYEDALEQVRRVLSARTSQNGPEHPLTFGARNALALVLYEAERLQEAESTARSALVDCEAANLGDTHEAWAVRETLVPILTERGHVQEAATLGEAVHRRALKLLGPEHPQALIIAGQYAVALSAAGRAAEAAEMLSASVESARRMDQEHITAGLERCRGRVLTALRRFEEARASLDRAWGWYETRKLPTQLRRTADAYVALFEAVGDQAVAESWRSRRRAATQPLAMP